MGDAGNRSRNDDFSAFQRALTSLLPRLRGFGRAYCGNAADGDDMVQLTCERALSRWTQWKGDGSLEGWLKRILINGWHTECRARRLRAVTADDRIIEEKSREASPDDSVFLDQVQAKIMQLPDGQREVLLLVAAEGLSYREAGELLKIPVGTVMSRLSRARASLIDTFGDRRDD